MTDTAVTLDAIADDGGRFAVVAIDQRNSLRRLLDQAGRPSGDGDLSAFKVAVCAALTPGGTGVLIDPDYGVGPVAAAGARAASCGLLVSGEPPDQGSWEGEPRAHRDPERSAAWLRAMGADAVKFLVRVRPDRPRRPGQPDLAAEAVEVVRQVVVDSRAVGLPSVIEAMHYPLPGEWPLDAARMADVVIETARLLDETGADLLKLEYPGDAAGCRRLAATVRRPWAVLSAGVDFQDFLTVVRDAADLGGASGFIGGRALWKEAVPLDGPARTTFLEQVAAPRLDACRAAIADRGRPWRNATATRSQR